MNFLYNTILINLNFWFNLTSRSSRIMDLDLHKGTGNPLNIMDLDFHKGTGNPPMQHPESTSDTLFCSTLNSNMKLHKEEIKEFSDISEFTTNELQSIRLYGWDAFCGKNELIVSDNVETRLPPEELDLSKEHSIEKILSYGYIVGCTQKEEEWKGGSTLLASC